MTFCSAETAPSVLLVFLNRLQASLYRKKIVKRIIFLSPMSAKSFKRLKSA